MQYSTPALGTRLQSESAADLFSAALFIIMVQKSEKDSELPIFFVSLHPNGRQTVSSKPHQRG